jgi:hypothetical protein
MYDKLGQHDKALHHLVNSLKSYDRALDYAKMHNLQIPE